MASDCTLVKGVKLLWSVDAGTTYVDLADLVELGAPGTNTRPKIDKTPLNPSTDFREYSFGLAESGSQTFKQLWNKTREAALRAEEGQTNKFRILYPDAALDANKSKDEFDGALTKVTKEPMNNADARIVLDCEITITGKVTFTAGT